MPALLLAGALCGGCHLLFPYEDRPLAPAPDTRPPRDAGKDRDLPGPPQDALPPPPDFPAPPTDGPPSPPPDGPPPPPDQSPPTPDKGNNPVWWTMTSGTTVDLYAVWALGPKDVYAAGDKGTLLHYNGNSQLTWTAIPTQAAQGTVRDLRAMHGLSSSKVLVMGRNNADLACDKTGCTKSPFRNLLYYTKSWNGVWCTPGSLCFVGGTSSNKSKGYLMKMTGSIWWELCSKPGSMLSDQVLAVTGVPGATQATVYAVGLKGTVARYKTLGGCTSLSTTGVTHRLNGVWTTAGAPLYVVGDSGTLLSYDGSNWAAATVSFKYNLYAVWGNSAKDVWVAGYGGYIAHFTGSKWSTPNLPQTKDLHAIHGTSPQDIYIVGKGGTILRFN